MFSPGRIVPILFPVTLAALLATLPAPAAPLTLTAGSEWAPWEHSPEIEPDGVFDLSRYVTPDAPAGCHGPLIVTPDGHFAFAEAPARRVRLRGVNLCFGALYLEKEEADRLAERLARSGYNTVRFHHYDGLLVRRGGKSWELDLQKLDQLDYLFAAMKKRGLAINIDLFSTRGFHPDEIAGFGIDASKKGRRMKFIFKGLVHISEPAFQSWARFARNLLSHKNPYTGLTWAEDPALVGICPVNEDSPYARVAREPDLRPRYEKAFADWRSRPENRDAIPPCETGPQREAAFNRFIFEESIRSDARMTAFLRSLGTRALITGSNHRVAQGLTYVREHYDFVDNHQYWDHPKFPKTSWQLPFAYHQGSAITGFANSATPPSEASAGAGWVPLGIAPSRIAGKPFVITEFNYVRPNRYRAEGGVLMPAFAGLQDWDALYNFEYAMTRRDAMNGGVENPFSLVCDPVGLIADRLSTLLFLRGDIAPARNLVVYAVQPDEAFADRNQSFPAAFRHLGLITRIASRTGSPSAVLAATRADAIVTGDMRGGRPPGGGGG
ncbi:MAG: glycosyl hydrolase family 5, partial [Opitutaceae bacterium]|nr:glycosyl hydrolase family 5 [Opitutaceae bacterium]